MGTVFGKNKTSSSITVAGHKTYYIDSTDAEIVEVEGQGGGGSTASDDATGTISGVSLPTAHSYTGASFDSLRYYVKGTVSDSQYAYGLYGKSVGWYGGVITWFDSSVGDLSDKIFTTGDPDASTSRVKQTILRVLLITNGGITGYPVWDTLYNIGVGQISSYTYNNGQHSITLWFSDIGGDWTTFDGAGRLMLRYLDDVTPFNNLSAFDLVNVSGGSLSKATTTDRYDMYNVWNGNITLHALYGSGEAIRRNAFKYLLSGTPYWYVIDGEHDTWTDDLSAWGYSEVPVGPVLPEVILMAYSGNEWNYPTSFNTNPLTFVSGEQAQLYIASGTSFSYESDKVYSVGEYQNPSGTTTGRYGFSVVSVNSKIGCKNISGGSITIQRMSVYRCSNSTATVVPVYSSSNVAYNAFKFTASGTDYYYVLDGTQTDWTDDLENIGYSLTPVVKRAYLTNSPHSDKYLNEYSTYSIVDENNNHISYDSTKSYTLIGKYKVSGSAVAGNVSLTSGDDGYGRTILKLYNSTPRVEVGYVEYTVS